MGTLTTTKLYADGYVLLKSDLDAFLNDIETFFNTTKIDGANIQAASITGSDSIKDVSISTAKILAANITEAKIAVDAVITATLATDAVVTAALATDAVTAAKILDNNISTAKISSSPMLALQALPYVASASLASFSTTSDAAWVELTDLSITGTTTGRPVLLMIMADGSSAGSYLEFSSTATPAMNVRLQIKRDATLISQVPYGFNLNATVGPYKARVPGGLVKTLDIVGAGTYTYSVYARVNSSAVTATFQNLKLVAVEL